MTSLREKTSTQKELNLNINGLYDPQRETEREVIEIPVMVNASVLRIMLCFRTKVEIMTSLREQEIKATTMCTQKMKHPVLRSDHLFKKMDKQLMNPPSHVLCLFKKQRNMKRNTTNDGKFYHGNRNK